MEKQITYKKKKNKKNKCIVKNIRAGITEGIYYKNIY